MTHYSEAGKGGNMRPTDHKKWSNGYDNIQWTKEEDEEFISEEEGEDLEPKVNYGSKYAILPSYSEPLEGEVIIPKSVAKKVSEKPEKPTLPYSDKVWDYPNLNLLDEPDNTPPDRGDVKARARIIEDTFSPIKSHKTKIKEDNSNQTSLFLTRPDCE